MGVELLTEWYSKQIAGILSCYDRILIFGTLPKICYAEGMTSWLYQLCYVRVPTWLPCRLQFYCNGHNWLALQLKRKGIAYKLVDNAFSEIGDWERAQKISDGWEARRLHWKLDEFARRFCPIFKHFGVVYHWSIDQAEYATDVVFKRQADLAAIYDNLTRTAIHTVKPDNIATFLGRKLNGNYQDERGNRFNSRIEGTRIKHSMEPV